MMNPLTRSAYAVDVRHLVQFSGIAGVLACDTPAEWARIEHALTARDSRTPDEALALRIVRALLNALVPPRDRGADWPGSSAGASLDW